MADTKLVCTVCGKERRTDFAISLREGWAKCCGYTMRLESTTADIDAAVGSAFAPLRSALRQPGDPK